MEINGPSAATTSEKQIPGTSSPRVMESVEFLEKSTRTNRHPGISRQKRGISKDAQTDISSVLGGPVQAEAVQTDIPINQTEHHIVSGYLNTLYYVRFLKIFYFLRQIQETILSPCV